MLQISAENLVNSLMMNVPCLLLWMLGSVDRNTWLLRLTRWEELGGSKAGLCASVEDTLSTFPSPESNVL